MILPTQSETFASSNPEDQSQLDALLHRTAIAPLDGTGWIRVTGEDRVRWLNGMVTNSIQDLPSGHGNYNFILSAQGRIQGDATIYAHPDFLLLETSIDQVPALLAFLDRFIIMDDVELTDVSTTRSGLLIAGPGSASLLEQVSLPVTDLAPHQVRAAKWQSHETTLLQAYGPLVSRFEIWADPAAIAALSSALQATGATVVNGPALEQLRILEGTPRYGADIRDRELPQETAPLGTQSRALHFSKGCYLGQEIVERIRSRGNVHRSFTAFRLEGTLPAPGTLLESDAKQIGELTSISAIALPNQQLQVALGYARREVLDRNLPITYPGGIAIPVSMPLANIVAG